MAGEGVSSTGQGTYTTETKPSDPGSTSNDNGDVAVESDTACAKLGEASTVLVQGPGAPRFIRLGSIGERRFASSEEDIVVFDADGGGASAPFHPNGADLVAAASNGSVLGVASFSSAGTKVTRYDDDGSKMDGLVLDSKLAAGDPALAIGAMSQNFLVVRSNGTSLRAVEVGTQAGNNVDFGAGTFGSAVSIAIAKDAVAWAGQSTDGTWRLSFARWGKMQSAKTVVSSKSPLRISRLVTTSTGFAAILGDADVAILDSTGALSGPIHRYTAATYAYDIASNGSQLALVAKSTAGIPIVRTLDSDGSPAGSWTCLADSIGSKVGGGAVDIDSAKKWAVVFTAPDGSARFTRL